VCLCPFHDDTNPSLRLRDEKQYYHCFACGAHGDVVTFAMHSLDLSYLAAVRHLSILLDSGSLVLSTPKTYSTGNSSRSRSQINQLNRIAKPIPLKQNEPDTIPLPNTDIPNPEPLPVYFDLLRAALEYFTSHLLKVRIHSLIHSFAFCFLISF
jgi:hypothetical protein